MPPRIVLDSVISAFLPDLESRIAGISPIFHPLPQGAKQFENSRGVVAKFGFGASIGQGLI